MYNNDMPHHKIPEFRAGMADDPRAPMPPPPPQQIFVNRNLRMDTVKAIGFDMDYTLARYRTDEIEELAHKLTLQKLIVLGYPAAIADIPYNKEWIIRGIAIDRQYGNLLKLDRHKHVSTAFHGHTPLSKKERRTLYRREHITFTPPRFAFVDTLFALPEMSIYIGMIEMLDSKKTDSAGTLDYWKLYDDIRSSIDEIHRDDSLKSEIKKDLPRFLDKDPLLAATLHKLRSSGKKVFLMTNSYMEYTDHLMTYLLTDERPEYGSWHNYFDIIHVGAKKPSFFSTDEPLCEISRDGRIISRDVTQLKRGKLYQGGGLEQFEKLLHYSGDEILYVGDHIYGDIVRSKKTSLWRTALIVEELEEEIKLSMEHRSRVDALTDLEVKRRQLDDLANLQRRYLASTRATKKETPNAVTESIDSYELKETHDEMKQRKQKTMQQLRQIVRKQAILTKQLRQSFNHRWGMVFKDGDENSRFGEQVGDYACIYTSRVTNFFYYSPYQYFRSARDLMPHEQAVMRHYSS